MNPEFFVNSDTSDRTKDLATLKFRNVFMNIIPQITFLLPINDFTYVHIPRW